MDIHTLRLLDIHPSQFYISRAKLEAVRCWFDPSDLGGFHPLPVKLLRGRPVFTDGHTRALAAYLAGLERVPLVWDEDELDWDAYQLCADACESRGVQTIADLRRRILSPEENAVKWSGWCDAMQEVLALQRCAGKQRQNRNHTKHMPPGARAKEDPYASY